MTAVQGFSLIYIGSSQRRLETLFRLACRCRKCRQSGRSHLRIRNIVTVADDPVYALILYSHVEFLLQHAGGSVLIKFGLERHARLQTHRRER